MTQLDDLEGFCQLQRVRKPGKEAGLEEDWMLGRSWNPVADSDGCLSEDVGHHPLAGFALGWCISEGRSWTTLRVSGFSSGKLRRQGSDVPTLSIRQSQGLHCPPSSSKSVKGRGGPSCNMMPLVSWRPRVLGSASQKTVASKWASPHPTNQPFKVSSAFHTM